jgi:hypothetical protein
MHAHLKKAIDEVIQYDPKDKQKAAYYRVGGDWTKSSEYPQIFPLDKYRKEDFLRLAWELLRRSPRYRHQYHMLKEFGIKKSTFSGFKWESYFSNTVLPDFEGWESIPLLGHQCFPSKSSREQTFGEYIAERKGGESWFVMNRRRWVMDLWGLKFLPNPDKNYLNLKDKDLFLAPAGAILVNNDDVNSPRIVTTYAGQNEVVFKLRLDAPLESQLSAIKHEISRLQSIADEHVINISEPFSLPRIKKTNKELAKILEEQKGAVLNYDERHGRVLLKQLELSPLWLRTWDAVQRARKKQSDSFQMALSGKHQWPRIDRVALVTQFKKDYLNHFDLVSQSSNGCDAVSHGKKTTRFAIYDELEKSLKPASVPNWRERSEKYIESGDGAYRQIVAMAFAKNNSNLSPLGSEKIG